MAVDWLFLLLSWLPYPVLMYCHTVMTAVFSLAFLYICILSQRRVTLLLRQACCCCQPSEPVNTVEWGEEMSSMNTAIFWVNFHFFSVVIVVSNSTWQHFINDTDINLCHWQRICCLQPSQMWRYYSSSSKRPKSPEIWHCDGQVVCSVLKRHSAFKILLTAHPLTQHVIPEDLNFLHHTTLHAANRN